VPSLTENVEELLRTLRLLYRLFGVLQRVGFSFQVEARPRGLIKNPAT
jgi:hypothetical protein